MHERVLAEASVQKTLGLGSVGGEARERGGVLGAARRPPFSFRMACCFFVWSSEKRRACGEGMGSSLVRGGCEGWQGTRRLEVREAARQLERQRERVRIKRFAQALPM